MNFSEELARRIACINKEDGVQSPQPRYDVGEVAKVIKTALKPPTVPMERRYNIHKRSLPEGMDKPIMYNLSKLEAEWMIRTKLKTLITQENKDKEMLIYYDAVLMDASVSEASIYYNPPLSLKEDEQEEEPSLLGSNSEWRD